MFHFHVLFSNTVIVSSIVQLRGLLLAVTSPTISYYQCGSRLLDENILALENVSVIASIRNPAETRHGSVNFDYVLRARKPHVLAAALTSYG